MKLLYTPAVCGLFLALVTLVGCGGAERAGSASSTNQPREIMTMADTSRSEQADASFNVQKTDEQWRQELTDQEYHILREAGTERPFSGKYVNEKTPGTYTCAGCGQQLFESGTKFDSGCGWPSFYDAKNGENVILREDNSHGMNRVEVLCSRCGGHLGHVFKDAPDQPTGLRYCINSAAIDLEPKESDDKQTNE
jgi:peptide-methionine (R)-S-oxide reductase